MFIFVHFHTFIGEMFFVSCHSNPFKNIILSVIKFGLNCDDISKERSSSLKLWVAASDMIRFCMYLGGFGLSLRISSFTKYGKWSELLLIMIAEVIFAWSKCGNLQNIWSMKVQDRFELRVGRVIFGKKNYWYTSDRKIRHIFLFHLFAEDLYWNRRLSWHIYFPFGVC